MLSPIRLTLFVSLVLIGSVLTLDQDGNKENKRATRQAILPFGYYQMPGSTYAWNPVEPNAGHLLLNHPKYPFGHIGPIDLLRANELARQYLFYILYANFNLDGHHWYHHGHHHHETSTSTTTARTTTAGGRR